MEFHIENTEVYGLTKSIIASGNAMRTEMDYNVSKYFENLVNGIILNLTIVKIINVLVI